MPNSSHLQGHAIDFLIHGLNAYYIYEKIEQSHNGGLGWYNGGWVHIDWRNWEGKGRARWRG